MDRRSFLMGLIGVAGAAALTAALPREVQAIPGYSPDAAPPSGPDIDEAVGAESEDEGLQNAGYRGRRWRGRRYGWRGRRYGWRGRRYGWRRRYWRRRGYYGGFRRRCGFYVNRWGRRVWGCWRRW